jgi:hypothetical protein
LTSYEFSTTRQGPQSGTPTGPGTFTVTATNGVGDPAFSGLLTITPAAAPAFIDDTPTAAIIGVAYSYTFTASGYPAPTFTATGTLPAGLSLSLGGVLSGTPTGPGTFTVSAGNAVPVSLPASSPLLVPTGGGAAATPTGAGYWALSLTGQLSEHGNAADLGSAAAADGPMVAVNSTTNGLGYWLASANGGVFNFGDAHFYGSLGGHHLSSPVVAIARTPDDGGYWQHSYRGYRDGKGKAAATSPAAPSASVWALVVAAQGGHRCQVPHTGPLGHRRRERRS